MFTMRFPFLTKSPLTRAIMPLALLFSITFVSALVLAPVSAQADQLGAGHAQFAQTLAQAQAQPKSSVQINTVYDSAQSLTQTLTQGVLKKLEDVARNQANIWADTILEGQYEAAGSTRIDRVEVLIADQKPIAYRITYSEQGWFVGDCEYDYRNRELLKACSEGRVVESSFVSPDLKTWMRDDRAFAEFRN